MTSIPPGSYLRLRGDRVEKRTYWDLDFPDAGDKVRMKDPTPLVDELQGRLETAVERRLRSDVPVVTYISGGLDSTIVLGLCSRLRQEPIPAFTIGLDRAGPDERAHSTEAAETLGSPLTTVVMDRAKVADAFPELVVAAEGPIVDTSCAAMLRLAQAVHAQGYKVTLTGEGADKAFAGYIWYKSQNPRRRLQGRRPDLAPDRPEHRRPLHQRPSLRRPPGRRHPRRPNGRARYVRDDRANQADPLLRPNAT